MSANNGVIRIGRKGFKKFAFGEEGEPFEVDVVVAFQKWIAVDETIRQQEGDREGSILTEDMPTYHAAAVEFVKEVSNGQEVTTAEALDFLARLREQYDELIVFFRPRSQEELDSPDTSEAPSLRFSVEES